VNAMATLIQLSPLIVMMIIFYIVIFVPESRRKKKYGSMLRSLKVNDEIMTKGGIVGKIINIQDSFVVIQTGPDRVKIKLDKTGVLNLISEVTSDSKEPKKSLDKKEVAKD
jgi:preprotein translocase subunit YajC